MTLPGILAEIEELRQIMHRVARTKGTADKELLAVSRKLDAALNKYYWFQKGLVCDYV